MRLVSQRFFIYSCIYLRILIIFFTYLLCSTSTVLGTNGLNNADVPLSNKQTNIPAMNLTDSVYRWSICIACMGLHSYAPNQKGVCKVQLNAVGWYYLFLTKPQWLDVNCLCWPCRWTSNQSMLTCRYQRVRGRPTWLWQPWSSDLHQHCRIIPLQLQAGLHRQRTALHGSVHE